MLFSGVLLFTALCTAFWRFLPTLKYWRHSFIGIKGLSGPRNHFLGGMFNLEEARHMKDSIRVISSWCQKYGPAIKLSGFPISVVGINSPEYLQKFLGSKDPAHLHKTIAYEPLRPLIAKGLFTASGETWRSHRQPMSYINSFRSLQTYMNIFNKESVRICDVLETLFKPTEKGGDEENKAKPVSHLLTQSTLVTITEALFGRDLTADAGELVEIIKHLDLYKVMRDRRVSEPWLVFRPIFALHPLSIQFRRVASYLRQKWGEFLDEFVEELKVNPEGFAETKPQFVQMLRSNISREELLHEALTMTTAGYETTGVTLQFLLFFLALHPKHQQICREEVDALLSDHVKCPNGFISQQNTSELKQLERCISETLRFFPAVHNFSRKLEAPLQLDDNLVLPAGTNCVAFPREIHMNPAIFPNPEEFDPSRFTPEECRRRHPYAYIPFSAGSRKCIGFKFATFQMLVTAARILHNFELSTPHKFEEINVLAGFKINTEVPITFNFKKRVHLHHLDQNRNRA